jgi:hypothetical protein
MQLDIAGYAVLKNGDVRDEILLALLPGDRRRGSPPRRTGSLRCRSFIVAI